MKRFAGFVVSSLLFAGAFCAVGAPAVAADVFQFSNDGNWGARYQPEKGVFVVYDYRRSPVEKVEVTAFTLEQPLGDRAKWLIADDGVVWMIEGQKIVRRQDGKVETAVIPVAGRPYELIAIAKAPASEPTPAVVFLQGLPRGRVQEVRCKLEPGLFQASGWTSLCKTTLIELPEGSSFAYLEATFRADDRDADYTVTYGYNPVEGNNAWSTLKFFNGSLASEYGWGRNDYGQSYEVSTNGLWKIHASNSELKLVPYLGKRPARTIAQGASYWDVSADGRYVFFELPRSGETDVVGVVDLDASSPTMRRVTVPGPPSATLVSPNGKFVIHGPYQEPKPVAMLTDPHYGMSPELVVDVLMARITKALAENRYADALPPLAEIEAMGLPLDEDFHFYQADTLARAGRLDEAKAKASVFVAKYGRTSSHYARMVEILAQ